DDGSLARSTGGAAARGAMLIALALVIGLVLMAFALDDPQTIVTGEPNSTDTADEAGSDAAAGGDGSGEDAAATPSDGTGSATTAAPATIPEGIVDEPVVPGEVHPPEEVIVLVANGTGEKGVAGAVSDKLKARGYIANASNAPSTAEAVIYYRIGFDADARLVAEILGAPLDIIKPAPGDGTIAVAPEAVTDGRLAEANIVAIVGADNNIPSS
ncbi:MAG: hypothetical protein ACI81L_000957, partial [Verrucomicrobiales bacterium]